MPTQTEFYIAEAAVQAEIVRRGIEIPETTDPLVTETSAYLKEFFKFQKDQGNTRDQYSIKSSILSGLVPIETPEDSEEEEVMSVAKIESEVQTTQTPEVESEEKPESTEQTTDPTPEVRADTIVDMSYEQIMTGVSSAIIKTMGYGAWVVATKADHVVVTDWESGKFYKVPYTINGTDIELGEKSEVTQQFIERSQDRIRVFRSAKGETRWTTISSNTYRDSYKTKFSHEALQEAVDSMRSSGDYGELRLEHHPASRIGKGDYSAVIGDFLMEAGTFDDTPMARAAIKTLEEDTEAKFKISIGFFSDDRYLTKDGVYTGKVRIFERSVTSIPANPLTAISPERVGEYMVGADVKKRLADIVGEEFAEVVTSKGDEGIKSLMQALGVRTSDLENPSVNLRQGEQEQQEPPKEIVIKDKDGKVMRAVREDLLEAPKGTPDIADTIRAAVTEAITPIVDRLDALESGSRTNPNDEKPRQWNYRVVEDGPKLNEEEKQEAETLVGAGSGAFWDKFGR